AGTYNFVYQAKNSQGTTSGTTNRGKVSLTFPTPSNLKVTVYDGNDKKTTISDYRWIIEEDRTFYVDPKCTTNPPPAGCPGRGGGPIQRWLCRRALRPARCGSSIVRHRSRYGWRSDRLHTDSTRSEVRQHGELPGRHRTNAAQPVSYGEADRLCIRR